MALFIEIRSADGATARTRLDPGKNRLTVRLGDTYRIYDDQTGATPSGIAVKRIDNHLIVDGLPAEGTGGTEAPTVEFAEFYSVCSAGSPCQLVVDAGGGAAPVVVTPGTQPIGALADGSFVLYDPNFAANVPPTPSLGDGSLLRNTLYGVGGLAVVGLAVGGGGGGGDGDGGGDAPSNVLKVTSSTVVNDRTPVITGEGEAGARIVIRIDTNGDGTADVTYGTTVGPNFRWAIDLGTATPESGALPDGGLPDTSNIGVQQIAGTAVTNLPTFALAFDGVAPAPAVIATVAADNVVNAAEKQAGQTVTGSAEPGATVTLTWADQVRTAVVGADGQWQAVFDAASIPADGSTAISAIVTDAAGNVSAPAQVAVAVNTAPATLSVGAVTGDDRVNAAEATAGVSFGGLTDPGAAITVAWAGVTRPVTADGNGAWTVAIAPGEIPAVPDVAGTSLAYTISAQNPIGNTAQATGSVLVDRVAPAAPGLNPVAIDNTVNQPERDAGVAISGTAEPGTTVSVAWQSQSGSVQADGAGNWSVPFAAGAVPPDGATAVSVTATDLAGNVSAPTGLAVTVNTAPPPLALTAVAGGDNVYSTLDVGALLVQGTTTAGAAVTPVFNGVAQAPVAADGTGAWAFSYAGAELAGFNGVLVPMAFQTTNPVGNVATVTANVYVDRIVPAAAAGIVVGGDGSVLPLENFAVTGTAEVGSTVQVTIGIQTVAAVFGPTPGAWTAANFLSDGVTTTGTVTVTDLAGNATATPFNFGIAVAGSPPAELAIADFAGADAAAAYAVDSTAIVSSLVPLEPNGA